MAVSPSGFFAEFKAFALKGNMIDLAVGLIVGVAFGAMVNSLVTDVISAPLGFLMGGLDFADKSIVLIHQGAVHPITHKVMPKDVVLAYGKFLNAIINFAIQALAIFLVVKVINNMKRKEEETPSAPPIPTQTEILLTEIRDTLKARPV